MAIIAFYKRRRNHMRLLPGHSGGQYLRLMAISATEVLGTIPLGTFYIVNDAKSGVVPWKGWAYMHRHDSEVRQVPSYTWKNDHRSALFLEMFRWSVVFCAFLFFALFGFAREAREHYFRLYKFLAGRIRKWTSTPYGAPRVCVVRSLCYLLWLTLFNCLQYSVSP